MYFEVVATVLGSFGGATVVVAAFAHFLGKVWADRIAKQTAAKFALEIENAKDMNALALKQFEIKAADLLRDREHFASISLEFYQGFLKDRVETYLQLLKIKNIYISQANEEYETDLHDAHGRVYYEAYEALRGVVTERQLYVSNELEKAFKEFRLAAAGRVKYVGFAEGFSFGDDSFQQAGEKYASQIFEEFEKETSNHMGRVMDQIDLDVSKLRSRIELDR